MDRNGFGAIKVCSFLALTASIDAEQECNVFQSLAQGKRSKVRNSGQNIWNVKNNIRAQHKSKQKAFA